MLNRYTSIRKSAAISPAVKTGATVAAAATGTELLRRAISKLVAKSGDVADEMVLDPVKKGVKDTTNAGVKLAIGAIPLSALAAAYLASTITSPKVQAEVADDVLINATERESLATSMRDLEELKRANALSADKLKIHDQFI